MSASENEQNLGDYLRHHREKKGMTLEQVSSATKINIKILHFLESGQFSELPSKPFLRGFISAYCQFVGLDSQDTLSRYSEYIDKEILGKNKNKKKYVQYSVELKEGDSSKKLILGILIGFIVVGMLSYFVMKPKLKKKHEETVAKMQKENKEISTAPVSAPPVAIEGAPVSAPTTETKPTAPEIKTSETPPLPVVEEPKKVENVENAEATETEDKDPLKKGDAYPSDSIRYRVVLQAKENFWVRYKVDEFEVQSFVLLKEKYLVLKAMKSISFQTSNIDAVSVKKGQDFITINESNQLKKSEANGQTEFRLGDPKSLSEPSSLLSLPPLPTLNPTE